MKRLSTALWVGIALATSVGTASAATPKVAKHTKQKSSIIVTSVIFKGNKHVSHDELVENLANKEAGFLARTLGSGNYHPEELKMDALRVRDVLYQHGYLDARVIGPSVHLDASGKKATLTYTIREGVPYKTASVRIRHNRAIDVDALQGSLRLKKGETFNVEYLRQDLRTISKHVGNQGYAFARVEPRFQKHGNHTMSVIYTVQANTKATISDIVIRGNIKTRESTIRNYISLAPGDRYRLGDLLDAQAELSRSGLFERVAIRPVDRHNGHVDVVIDVEEAKTGQIMGAVGYDSMQGLFAEGSFSEKNLYGTGINTGITASYSKLKKNGTLFFDIPHVYGTDYGLYGGLSKTDKIDDNIGTYGYGTEELGAYLGVRKRLTSKLSASVDYHYNRIRYTDVNTSVFVANPNYNLGQKDLSTVQNYIKSAIGLSLTYNSTNSFYQPSRGIYLKFHTEYAGIGSGTSGYALAKYIKNSLKFATYYGLEERIGHDVILRYKTQINYIHDMGFVPDAETFRIGGFYRGVRGYRSASIQPKTGPGLRSAVASIEASLGLSKRKKIRMTAFADYGMIGYKSWDEEARKSVGAQIEWRSPFGDVNFIFAKAIQPKKDDETSSFEFTIGKEF